MFLIWFYIEKFKTLSKTKFGMFCLVGIAIGCLVIFGEYMTGISTFIDGMIVVVALVATLYLIASLVFEIFWR